jgi:colanic acid biosynthesis glycosyl transferase WcaI
MSGSGGLRVQLWSYNYDPEPMGIGPVSTVWARELSALGHDVHVVAAHPHYPEPRWGKSRRPYREVRDGIPVLRLPLSIGRASTAQRYRQELSFMVSQAAATPFLGRPDVLVSASPSFPALLPAVVNSRLRRVPWVLWLHDILPDGAAATGLIDERSPAIRAARWLERTAYRSARRIVVLSRSFTDNLLAKGVPAQKIELIYDPATRKPGPAADGRPAGPPSATMRLLSMGNIGHSQGLTELLRAFEASELPDDVRLAVTGSGVAAPEARAEVRTERVQMLGVLDDEELEAELQRADIGFVSQRYEGAEFNIPSKLMNFMAYGLPVLAAVNPASEVARIVEEAAAGWVVDSSDPGAFPREVARLSEATAEVADRAAASREFAERHFTQEGFGRRFDELLREVVAEASSAN